MWDEIIDIGIETLKRCGPMVGGYFLRRIVSNRLKIFWKKFTNKPTTIPDIYGIELLQVILEENYIQSQKIQDIFGSQEECNSILKGQKELTFLQIQQLSNFLMISPSAFFPDKSLFGR